MGGNIDREEFIDLLVTDLGYAASVANTLIQNPTALREVLRDERVRSKVVEDPVFFAVLMCGDKWLVDAPDHQELLRDMHPRQVAVCGRGWGKSLVFSRKNLWLIYTKPNIESLIISSTQRQSMIMFDYCYLTIQKNPLMQEMVKRPGTTRTTIRLKRSLGGRLVALPCSPNKLRGFHPDWVFCDEASIIPSEMITSEIMPMSTKPEAHFVMSGTPKSFDHIFRQAFLDNKRYSVHHYPSSTSPLVDKKLIDEWRQDMPREEWMREVEAKWTEAANVYFPMDLIIGCVDSELGDPDSPNHFFNDLEKIDPMQVRGRTFYGGLDLGKQIDHSVLVVIEKADDKRRLVYKNEFPLGTIYPSVIGHIVRADQVFDLEELYVDKSGVGDAVVDELEEIGMYVEGLFLTERYKEEIFGYLKFLMEQKRLRILGDDAKLIAQISEQRYEYLKPKTAQERVHLKFSHPRGRHDDQLVALALACYASKEEKGVFADSVAMGESA